MYNFNIPNTKVKTYQFFAYGIILINLVIQLYVDNSKGTKNYYLFTILLSAALFFIVARDAFQSRKGKPLTPIGLLILLIAVRWFRFANYYAFFINIALWLLYTISRRNMNIKIREENIEYPSFPKKLIQWHNLNNVILKDGLLTIDQKNNQLYQHYILDDNNTVNEQEFNDFCKEHLKQIP